MAPTYQARVRPAIAGWAPKNNGLSQSRTLNIYTLVVSPFAGSIGSFAFQHGAVTRVGCIRVRILLAFALPTSVPPAPAAMDVVPLLVGDHELTRRSAPPPPAAEAPLTAKNKERIT